MTSEPLDSSASSSASALAAPSAPQPATLLLGEHGASSQYGSGGSGSPTRRRRVAPRSFRKRRFRRARPVPTPSRRARGVPRRSPRAGRARGSSDGSDEGGLGRGPLLGRGDARQRSLRALKLARRRDEPCVAAQAAERAPRRGGGARVRRRRLERLGFLRGIVHRGGGDPEQRPEHAPREHPRGERVQRGPPRPGGQRARQRGHRLDGGDGAVRRLRRFRRFRGLRAPLGAGDVRGVLQLKRDHERELPWELRSSHERRAPRADRAVLDGARDRRRAHRRGHGELPHGAASEPKRPGRRRRARGRRHQPERAVERRAVRGARGERTVGPVVRPAPQRVEGGRS